MRILIMGLPGSGKTTLAQALQLQLDDSCWYNADLVRENFNDWDFSYTGRLRQATRMRELADDETCKYVICDFVAPLKEMRDIFEADFTVWMDTIEVGRFEDTNKMFEKPLHYDVRVTEQNSDKWSKIIAESVINSYK